MEGLRPSKVARSITGLRGVVLTPSPSVNARPLISESSSAAGIRPSDRPFSRSSERVSSPSPITATSPRVFLRALPGSDATGPPIRTGPSAPALHFDTTRLIAVMSEVIPLTRRRS